MNKSEEELKQQIIAVFEDYDDGLSDKGWTELRKKYPERKNRRLPIWWLTGAAAALLVLAGLYFNRTFETKKVILRTNEIVKENATEKNPAENRYHQPQLPNSQELSTPNTENDIRPNAPQHPTVVSQLNKQTYALQNIAVVRDLNIDEFANKASVTVPDTVVGAVEKRNGVIAAITNEQQSTTENKSAMINGVPEKVNKLSTEEFLNEQSKVLANRTKDENKQNRGTKTTFDVFTGTFFNYYDDNESKLSGGLGVNANIQITKNVTFSFGAGLSQNKVSYASDVPVAVASAMTASKNEALYASPTDAVISATATNNINFNGRLLSIDLPMVVKFYPSNKQDFYISTGINSSSYLSQRYTYNYSVSNFTVRNGAAQPQQETEKSTLKGFDFANNAIIAIGINQNIGKNTLIFEPYYKPAIGTMGDKNLRISSAGLNLKFNFNGGKK